MLFKALLLSKPTKKLLKYMIFDFKISCEFKSMREIDFLPIKSILEPVLPKRTSINLSIFSFNFSYSSSVAL